MSTYIRNCYKHPLRLFVIGGKELLSQEGTTQGDPLVMPTYAIGIIPMLPRLKTDHENIEIKEKHVAYADDLGGAGKLEEMLKWWNNVKVFGPLIGYYPNAFKSWLVVKEKQFELAKEIFKNTNINVTTEGRKYLGGFIGNENITTEFIQNKIGKHN